MSDSTPAKECTIPRPGPSAEHDRRADGSLSLRLRFDVLLRHHVALRRVKRAATGLSLPRETRAG